MLFLLYTKPPPHPFNCILQKLLTHTALSYPLSPSSITFTYKKINQASTLWHFPSMPNFIPIAQTLLAGDHGHCSSDVLKGLGMGRANAETAKPIPSQSGPTFNSDRERDFFAE